MMDYPDMDDENASLYQYAKAIFEELVSEIIITNLNGYKTFFIAGSVSAKAQ